MLETLIILGIASLVLYYLYITFKEYLGNENNQKRFLQEEKREENNQIEPTLEEKVRVSEYGVLSGILGYVANADQKICPLEKAVAHSLLEEMAQEMFKNEDKTRILQELQNIFFESKKDIAMLCKQFVGLTKGEYKKKLKVVEFCFVLGYADGSLDEETKEAIIDVGALLELSNEDFNALYDDFAKQNEVQMTLQEAKEIFPSSQDLEKIYLELIQKTKQNLADEENLHSFDGKKQLLELQRIQKAYELLKHS